ncbi:ABC transporter permease [Mangrovibacterium marinum]|uniref:Phospholipid/cholesterol/gamma-HCH transport system permease protein n=1 Tax=Mangrovibacterium marinum TaxID=1639118 RepID=A0A2T5C3E9_9BACT|nr:ABC transporter permease [Mangrovibacterium marinum]PTN09249.1 phospholipid/cholesterol/gamma-HCH transport system permease protein [Mangrovibacterium marinum]
MKILRTNESLNNFFSEIGGLVLFARNVGQQFFRAPFEYRELVKQGYFIGVKTLPLVAITAFIMGMVLTLQSRPVLMDFGAGALLPGMVSVSFIREIGPVITALLCAGKISSGIGAELGAMKVTEQLDAMEVSGTKPLNFVVATRVIATTCLVPILAFIADAIGMLGSYLSINMYEPMSVVLFFSQAFDSLRFYDIIPATIKTFFFGFFIGLIGSYKGYTTGQGTEAVGMSANAAVVSSSLAIFLIDLIAVQLSNLIYGI